MWTPANRRRGISLLEAVVGLVMVGMTAAAALGATAADMRVAERGRHAIEAAALASQRLQLLNLLTYTELLSLPDSTAHGRFAPPFDAYSWTTSVSVRAQEEGVFDVALRITWASGGYTVASALYRRPLVPQQ